MSGKLSSRLGYITGTLICAALLAFGYFLQFQQGEEPCPLCIMQRMAFFAAGAIFLVAALHGPRRTGSRVYAIFILIAVGIGAAIAARQVWLQHLPKDKVPACGPGLNFILESFPLSKALEMVFKGSGECAAVGWQFLGLSIAGWALIWFVILGLLAIAAAAMARK